MCTSLCVTVAPQTHTREVPGSEHQQQCGNGSQASAPESSCLTTTPALGSSMGTHNPLLLATLFHPNKFTKFEKISEEKMLTFFMGTPKISVHVNNYTV